MHDGVIKIVPNAKIGHIGMYRDEKTAKPINYYFKVPNGIKNKEVIIIDPMLATGGSAVDAIDLLKEKGVKKIKFLCIISTKEGIDNIKKNHKDVDIYTAHIDERLNEKKYICQGLVDSGDKEYGTK